MNEIAAKIEMLLEYIRENSDNVEMHEAANDIEVWLATYSPDKDL